MYLSFVLWIYFGVAIVASDDVNNKRLILHDDEAVANAIQTMSADIQKMNTTMTRQDQTIADLKTNMSTANQNHLLIQQQQAQRIANLEGNLTETKRELTLANQKIAETTSALSNNGQGSTYIRWGRTVCPGNGTDLVYKGFAGGNWYSNHGGAADYICLTQDPIWGVYDDSHQSHSGRVYGVEYEFGEDFNDGGTRFFGQNLFEHDTPCALCHSSRQATVMIPGRNQCYAGWTMEYSGYLVSGRAEATYDVSATNYVCLDMNPDVEFGDQNNQEGKLMVTVEAFCGSLKCPPYVQNREITCVVCSK